MTTDRAAHDYAAGTVEFFGPGNPAFPVVDGEKAELPPHRSVSEILGGPAGGSCDGRPGYTTVAGSTNPSAFSR